MNHLTVEQLVEHLHGEDGWALRARARRHLAGCTDCGEALAAVKADLAAAQALLTPGGAGERDEAYGERVWAAIEPALKPYEGRRRRAGWSAARGLAYAAGLAVMIAAAFFAGRIWEQRQASPTVKVTPAPGPRQPVIVVVLSDHLDRSERLLVQLKHADPESGETISPLRDEARSLLAANRICRRDARKFDDPGLDAALDRLDRLLAELANHPGGLDAASIARLQKEMNADDLLFEVRVLRARIPERRSAVAPQNEGLL